MSMIINTLKWLLNINKLGLSKTNSGVLKDLYVNISNYKLKYVTATKRIQEFFMLFKKKAPRVL